VPDNKVVTGYKHVNAPVPLNVVVAAPVRPPLGVSDCGGVVCLLALPLLLAAVAPLDCRLTIELGLVAVLLLAGA
jgi:hypothetical protein